MLTFELVLTAFLAIVFAASLIASRAKIPYTLVLVFLGIALAIASTFLLSQGGFLGSIILQLRQYSDRLTQGGSEGLFVGLVIPPLIFEAMVHVKSSDLKAVIRPASYMATIGVLVSTVVGGLLLWKLAQLPFYVSFLFAALISPTDAATVLEIFRRAKVPSKLATMMNIEAAFNDATGIVIFTIVLASISFPSLPIIQSVYNFSLVFGGGILVGFSVAFVAELLSSLIEERLSETILTISAVYGSYVLATGFGFSGLIAVAIVGLYFGNYTIRPAVAPGSRETITIFWQIAAFLGNSVAFLLIGLRTDLLKLSQSVELIAIAF